MPAQDLEAIITAAGQGARLGLGPKAFVMLGGRTLLEHSVASMLSVAARVTVAVPPADLSRAESLVADRSVRVIAGGARRVDTLRALVGAASADWLLLQDVVHPFVTKELSQLVIEGAYRTGAAAAAQSNVDFLYGTDGQLLATPGRAVAIQKPVAFRRTDIARGFEVADCNASGSEIADLGSLDLLALAGQCVAFVPGGSLNFKLTTNDDMELAQRLCQRSL